MLGKDAGEAPNLVERIVEWRGRGADDVRFAEIALHSGGFEFLVEFLGLLALTSESTLRDRVPSVDVGLLARYLRTMERVASGDALAGPIGLAPTSERFHWLTAPRSDVLQSSPVHEGLCEGDPARTLARLFAQYVSG